MNTVRINGYIAREPFLFKEDKGASIVIANNMVDGYKREKPYYISCVAFDKHNTKVIKEHLKTGDKIIIEGNLIPSDYEKDGVHHYTLQVKINNIEFERLKKGENERKVEELDDEFETLDLDNDEIPFKFNY